MLPEIDTEVDPSPKKLAPTPSETTQTTRIAELCHQSYICNNVYRVQLWNALKGRNTLQHNRQPQCRQGVGGLLELPSLPSTQP